MPKTQAIRFANRVIEGETLEPREVHALALALLARDNEVDKEIELRRQLEERVRELERNILRLSAEGNELAEQIVQDLGILD